MLLLPIQTEISLEFGKQEWKIGGLNHIKKLYSVTDNEPGSKKSI